MAERTEARPAAARPPRASSVPAFGGWEGGAVAPDYSLDFTAIRAARMQRRTKALSWSSFAAAVVAEAPSDGEEELKRQWSSAAASDGDGDDDRERRHRHGQRHPHRRLRSDDDVDDDRRQPIRPGRPTPKSRSKFKGYLFGCVAG